jgi:hypothetical protein
MSIVQLADMKAHLNVTFSDDDALIQAKIDAAEDFISRFCVTVDPCDPDSTSMALWSANSVTPGIIAAIKLLAAHLYANREASVVGVTAADLPFGLFDLLGPFRTWVF